MPNSQFDPRVETGGVNLFLGEFTKISLSQNPSLPHHVGNRVINPSQPFTIRLGWKVTGAEVPLRMNAVGNWQVYAYAESIGPGPEKSLLTTPDPVARGTLATEMSWEHDITVPAGTLPEHDANDSGMYRIGVVVFANSNLPGYGDDVIGFTEVLTIMAEDPH